MLSSWQILTLASPLTPGKCSSLYFQFSDCFEWINPSLLCCTLFEWGVCVFKMKRIYCTRERSGLSHPFIYKCVSPGSVQSDTTTFARVFISQKQIFEMGVALPERWKEGAALPWKPKDILEATRCILQKNSSLSSWSEHFLSPLWFSLVGFG